MKCVTVTCVHSVLTSIYLTAIKNVFQPPKPSVIVRQSYRKSVSHVPPPKSRRLSPPSTMTDKQIYYSDKYYDDKYEYRHVVLPKEMAKSIPKTHLLTEDEWRSIGVQQSKGWVHYMIHEPEPHILLFKRPRTN